jgi:hypothetical protein
MMRTPPTAAPGSAQRRRISAKSVPDQIHCRGSRLLRAFMGSSGSLKKDKLPQWGVAGVKGLHRMRKVASGVS